MKDLFDADFIVKGFLRLGNNGKEDDILYLDEYNESSTVSHSENYYEEDSTFVEKLQYKISGKFCTIRYFICDEKTSYSELNDNLIRQIEGDVSADYGKRYSEYTGYLWTDEELNVGGHDLLNELKSYENKYIFMIIDIDKNIEIEREFDRRMINAKNRYKMLEDDAKFFNMTVNQLIKKIKSEL